MRKVAFYILTEEKRATRQMTGPRAAVAGTVNGQPKTVALIRGVQFKGEIRRLEGDEEATSRARRTIKRFPVARMLSAPVWESGSMKSNSPTTRWALVKNDLATRLRRRAGVTPRG